MKILMSFVVLVLIFFIALTFMRNFDELRSYRIWNKLEKSPKVDRGSFSPQLVEDMPDPARRYFEFMILPDTTLKHVARIEINGRLGLGSEDTPDYMDMQARQILSFPKGFVWDIKTGRGPVVLTGSDGIYDDSSWSRFWVMHSLPVGRAGGLSKHREDHRRAAFGRLVAEAAFWSPAALLPSQYVSWDAIGPNSARATVTYKGLIQTVEIFVTETGQPTHVIIPRWSDSNPENQYQIQPFGGYLSVFKEVEGYRLPMHVEGGNFIGTDGYFPFYIADIKNITFID